MRVISPSYSVDSLSLVSPYRLPAALFFHTSVRNFLNALNFRTCAPSPPIPCLSNSVPNCSSAALILCAIQTTTVKQVPSMCMAGIRVCRLLPLSTSMVFQYFARQLENLILSFFNDSLTKNSSPTNSSRSMTHIYFRSRR